MSAIRRWPRGTPAASDGGRSSRSPASVLFLVSGAVAVFSGAANGLWVVWGRELGRIRDLDLFWFLRHFLEKAHVDFLSPLPVLLGVPFDLRDPSSALLFVAGGTVATLLLVWALACLLLPFLILLRWALPPRGEGGFGAWLWGRAFGPTALALFAFPFIYSRVYDLLYGALRPVKVGAALAAATLLWGGALWVASRPWVRRGTRAAVLSAGALMACLLLLGAAGALLEAAEEEAPRGVAAEGAPNVLLVSIDTLRADHLGCYGYRRETSPGIDALAAEGALFRTVVAPSPWTLPSHLTLLTAQSPEEHGVIDDGLRLRPGTVTLAGALREAGYETAGFVSGPYLESEYGYSRGFDHYDDYTVAKSVDSFSWRGVTSPALVALVEEWLDGWEERGRRRPFFIFLHMWDVHYDFTPPPPYDTLFDPDYAGDVTGEDFAVGDQVHPRMDPRDLEHVVALYDGEIRYTDMHLARIVERLRGLGVLDDTIVVVTADHGEEFFEHGNKGHRKALYDESLLVPLVIRYPRAVPAGTVVPRQVRLMDVPATILSLAGAPSPVGFGTSRAEDPSAAADLTPLLRPGHGEGMSGRAAFADLHGIQAAIRTESRKLILRLAGPQEPEVYDLIADPGETRNLAASGPPALADLEGRLAAWRQAWSGAETAGAGVKLSREQMERLRSLGYVD